MKIKARVSFPCSSAPSWGVVLAGEVVELSDADAKAAIESGQAELTDEEIKLRPRSAEPK